MALFSRRQSMLIASFIMGMSVLLSRLMGLARDKVISLHYGASLESDLYFAAFVVPDFINYLLAGGYFAITLIPLLSSAFEQDEEDGWRLFSAVLWWMALSAGLATLLAMLLAPRLAAATAPGFDAQALARLAHFLRIILPAQLFFLTGSCFTSLLYLRRQFSVPALTPLVYNGAIIGLGLLLLDRGMEGFCWGVLAGSFLGNFLLPFWAASRGEGVRLLPCLRHKGLKRFLLLALPLMLGQSVVVLDEQLLRVFGSLAAEGAVSRLNYARRIMLVPVGVVAQAAGVASYPFLAALAARGDRVEFSKTLRQSLLGALMVLAPLSLWMLAAAEPTVALIFQQGRFDAADTTLTAWLLRLMLLGVFCWGLQQMLGRAFYARQDTLTPSVAGTLLTVAALPAYWGLTRLWGERGAALASVLSIAAYTLVLAIIWRRRQGGEALNGLGRALVQTLGLSGLSALPAWFAAGLPQRLWPEALYLSALAGLALSGLVFAGCYLLLCRLLAPELLEPLRKLAASLARRLGLGGRADA